jgi:transposase
METLIMSQNERVRLSVMKQVQEEELKLIEASEVLGLSYRQAKRVLSRFRAHGDSGLVHASRGRPGKRAKPADLKARILARYEERYPDFGPTLAAEYLAEEGLKVDHETLRRWLLAKGQPRMRRRRQRHRQWRERKPCFGALVQLDGSHHEWFEGRAAKCVLMVMVDDATGRVWAQFFEEETTRASYDILEGWVRRFGLPQSLYVDKDSIYRCEGLGSIAEQLAGKEPQTQFGRAMEQLGVELILADSPQAKGRVERMNGTLQDRLVKALRLAGINDRESGNTFLAQKFLSGFNGKFEVEPASQADGHGGIPRELNQVLSWEEPRVVQKDWTVVYQGQWYQLDRCHEALGLAGKQVIVRTLRDGTVQLERQGVKLRFRSLPERPQRVVPPPAVAKERGAPAKPPQTHPWRRGLLRKGRALRAAAPFGIGDSGRPPLRSGLPPSPIPNGEPAATTTNNQGTFSPELLRGHF